MKKVLTVSREKKWQIEITICHFFSLETVRTFFILLLLYSLHHYHSFRCKSSSLYHCQDCRDTRATIKKKQCLPTLHLFSSSLITYCFASQFYFVKAWRFKKYSKEFSQHVITKPCQVQHGYSAIYGGTVSPF